MSLDLSKVLGMTSVCQLSCQARVLKAIAVFPRPSPMPLEPVVAVLLSRPRWC